MNCDKGEGRTGGLCSAAAVVALAAAVAERRTNKEVGLLAAMFVQLGDTLETIIAARECSADASQEN
ncbi:MAG: DUF6774 domain-containing protein [Oscillospiraceae bacterium]|nr:hypothetical protein [Oscillospiraceae bacterium]MDY2847311.1 DUF6774 domain-containing protein [Oscillospiraceae bacterium]